MTETTAEDLEDGARERRIVNMALRLPPKTHDALRKVAYEKRVSIHSLIMGGIAEVLRKHGN
jgi:predicted HicB family RNase H-like nuclease